MIDNLWVFADEMGRKGDWSLWMSLWFLIYGEEKFDIYLIPGNGGGDVSQAQGKVVATMALQMNSDGIDDVGKDGKKHKTILEVVFAHELAHLIWGITGLPNEQKASDLLENPLLKHLGLPERNYFGTDKTHTIGGVGIKRKPFSK